MKSRDKPEVMDTPEFIQVIFDEKGKPIGAKPAKDVPEDLKEVVIKQPTPKPVLSSPLLFNREYIAKIMSIGSKNVDSLRKELRESNQFFYQALQNLKSNSNGQINGAFLESIKQLNEKIDNFEGRMRLQGEFSQAVNTRLDHLNEHFDRMQQNVAGLSTLSEKIDVLSVYFDELARKADETQSTDAEKMRVISSNICDLASQIAGIRSNEVATIECLKSFLDKVSLIAEEVKTQRLSNSTMTERIAAVEKELGKANESIICNNILDQDVASKIDENMIGLYAISQELDSFKSFTESSLKELKQGNMQMADLLLNQKQIADDTFLKMQKLLKKPKKVTKPQKAKVVKFLRKNFTIKPFAKVLVVADKRNFVFGKTVHEAVRAVSKKSVLAVTENRTKKTYFDKPVLEAMKKSDCVFIIGNFDSKKMKKFSEKLDDVNILSVKRTLRYSIV